MLNREKNNLRLNRGFTLIELTISSAIIFLVSITVFSVFASGINVWRRASQARSSYGYGLRLAADKLGVELRNAFRFTTIPFEGTEDSIFFANLVDNQVSRISYFVNEKDILCRRIQDYSDVFKRGESGKYDLLLSDVKKLKFSYCYLDNNTGDYKWKEKWVKEEQDSIPRAVKIELTFKNKPEGSSFAKTILIPIGTGAQSIELGQ